VLHGRRSAVSLRSANGPYSASAGAMCLCVSSRRSCAATPTPSDASAAESEGELSRVGGDAGSMARQRCRESWKHGSCLGYQIRLDLVLKVSALERRSCQGVINWRRSLRGQREHQCAAFSRRLRLQHPQLRSARQSRHYPYVVRNARARALLRRRPYGR